jgi:hypothetical protein
VATDFHGTILEDLGVRPQAARRLWREFSGGAEEHVDLIWSLFALTSWARRWLGSDQRACA